MKNGLLPYEECAYDTHITYKDKCIAVMLYMPLHLSFTYKIRAFFSVARTMDDGVVLKLVLRERRCVITTPDVATKMGEGGASLKRHTILMHLKTTHHYHNREGCPIRDPSLRC
jgi:hypothetical protein